MKLKSLLIGTVLCAAPVFASSVVLPFNTGVDNNGVIAAAGSVDQHYSSNLSWPNNSVYVEGSIPSAWVGADSASAWVGPDTSNGSSINGGVYTLDYITTFNLTGVNPSTFTLTGLIAADDNVNSVWVNGIYNQVNLISAYGEFSPFTLTNGFHDGLNTIDFNYSNTWGPGGIRIEFTTDNATPEPASIALFGFGVLGLGLGHKLRQRKA